MGEHCSREMFSLLVNFSRTALAKALNFTSLVTYLKWPAVTTGQHIYLSGNKGDSFMSHGAYTDNMKAGPWETWKSSYKQCASTGRRSLIYFEWHYNWLPIDYMAFF